MNSIGVISESFDSCNSCYLLESSRIYKRYMSQNSFVLLIGFISYKLSFLVAHVNAVSGHTGRAAQRRTRLTGPSGHQRTPAATSYHWITCIQEGRHGGGELEHAQTTRVITGPVHCPGPILTSAVLRFHCKYGSTQSYQTP